MVLFHSSVFVDKFCWQFHDEQRSCEAFVVLFAVYYEQTMFAKHFCCQMVVEVFCR